MFRRRRIGHLMSLIVLVAVGIKGYLIVQERRALEARRQAFLLVRMGAARPTFSESELLATLDDRSTRDVAAWALDKLGSKAPAPVEPAADLLSRMTEARYYSDVRRSPISFEPAETLIRIGPPASVLVPLLREAVASEDRWTRFQAIKVLSDAACRSGRPEPALDTLLLTGLRDPEPAIQGQVAEMISRFEGDIWGRAVAVLLGQIREADRPAQLQATLTLARFEPEARSASALLAGRLEKGELADRLADLYLLGRIGPAASDAVPAIVRAMMAPDAMEDRPDFLARFNRKYEPFTPWDVGQRVPDWERGESSPKRLAALGASVLGQIGVKAERRAVGLLILRNLQEQAEECRALIAQFEAMLGDRADAVGRPG